MLQDICPPIFKSVVINTTLRISEPENIWILSSSKFALDQKRRNAQRSR
jgi:hypothetical protein